MAETMVNANQIINQLHNRYGRQIANLVQENAELAAAHEQVSAERDELAAKLKALTE